MIESYAREINVQSALEYSLRWEMRPVTCEVKVYPLNFSFWTCTKLQILFRLGKPIHHLIYYAYQIFSAKSTSLA